MNLQLLDQNIETSHASGRLLFQMLSAISQFETELPSEPQMDGSQLSGGDWIPGQEIGLMSDGVVAVLISPEVGIYWLAEQLSNPN